MDRPDSERVIDAALSYISSPFRHHFRPLDLCQHGAITMDQCMEVGMDESGFDCSGFVIASICKAIGADTSQWNRRYRHLDQLRELGQPGEGAPGDAVLLRYYDHIGIASHGRTLIHASGISELVEIDALKDSSEAYAAIPLSKLVELVN